MFSIRKRTGFAAAAALLCGLLGTCAMAQDLSSFLAAPPAPGAWARYLVVTKAPGDNGPGKVETFSIAVTGGEQAEGGQCLWVEAGPQDFLTDRNGTLKVLLKAHPSPKEALNFLMEAQKAQYAPKDGPPYALSDGVLSFVRKRAANIVVEQTVKELGKEEVLLASGRRVECTKLSITTKISHLPFTSMTAEEQGIYWKSTQTPFGVVKAEIVRTETGRTPQPRVRNVSVMLVEDGFSGAASVIPRTPEKVRGLWSLLFD